MPTVLLSVINDLHSDQRVHRTCLAWMERGYHPILVGRTFPNPSPVERPYETIRLPCRFQRGPFFYLEYQMRLWSLLRKARPDVYLANDLDTLWPQAFWASRRQKPLVYDSHEYFLGAPELESRPWIQSLWRWVERRTMPRVDFGVTVNASIAQAYYAEYGQSMDIVRNVPLLPEGGLPFAAEGDLQQEERRLLACRALGLPEDRPIWILQGAGINMDRGAEELLQAAGAHASALLLLVGSGDAIPSLQAEAQHQGWIHEKVRFVGRVGREELAQYTRAAHVGFSLDKPKSQNYRWSLPNKLFDYFQAGIPVIASGLVEVEKHLGTAGKVLSHITPETILEAVGSLMKSDTYASASRAAQASAHRFHWGNEKRVWHQLIDRMEGIHTVHIWSMDRLEPPPYGGTLEVKGQLESLLAAGFQVVLHATAKERLAHPVPLQMTDYPGVQWRTYRRKKGAFWSFFTAGIPYMVGSRKSRQMQHSLNMAKGHHLVQGTHLTGLTYPASAILRWHNPEALYYKSLGEIQKGFKALYLRREATLLSHWETNLAKRWQGPVWVLSPVDALLWIALGGKPPLVLPPQKKFPGSIPLEPAQRTMLLVPGKFSVPENAQAACLTHGLSVSVTWAGHGFSKELRRSAAHHGITVLDQPDDAMMHTAFAQASMVLVHAEHSLGVKLKLIQALYQARWILAHEAAVQGLSLSEEAGILTYTDRLSLEKAIQTVENLGWDTDRAIKAEEARRFWTQPLQASSLL